MIDHEEHARFLDGIQALDKPRLAVVRTDPLAIAVLLVFSLLLAAGIAFVLTYNKDVRNATEAVIPFQEIGNTATSTQEPKPRIATFERWNMQGTLPNGWRETRRPQVLPVGIPATHKSYINTDRSCQLVYAPFRTMVDDVHYKPTQDARDIMRDGVFVGRVEFRSASTTTGTQHIALSYQPLYYNNGLNDDTQNAWLLYNTNLAATATPICVADFVTFLRSLTPIYERHTLTPYDSGLVYIETHDKVGTLLMFRDAQTRIATILTQLDTGLIFRPTLRGNTLYYVGTKGALKQFDLLGTQTPNTLPLSLTEGESVSDFTVGTSSIEYLRGIWCHTDTDACNLTHESHVLNTATTITITSNVTEPDLGHDNLSHAASLTFNHSTFTQGPDQFEGVVTARTPILLPK